MTEEQYFKRITMSLTDIQICLKYLEKVSKCTDDVIIRALSESIIISYVRPFSKYNKNYHEITDLKQEFKKKFTSNEINMHGRIYNLRNSIIAHSDSKSYGVSFTISDFNENSKMVLPTQRKIPVLLNDEDIKVLKGCCLKIETYLFDEQTRIKKFLPIGNY